MRPFDVPPSIHATYIRRRRQVMKLRPKMSAHYKTRFDYIMKLAAYDHAHGNPNGALWQLGEAERQGRAGVSEAEYRSGRSRR